MITFSEVLYNTVYFDTKKYVFHFPQSADEDMSYPFNCQLCIRRFAKKDKFEQHLRRHINSQKMEDAFACLFCNNATFPTCQVCSLTQFLFFRSFLSYMGRYGSKVYVTCGASKCSTKCIVYIQMVIKIKLKSGVSKQPCQPSRKCGNITRSVGRTKIVTYRCPPTSKNCMRDII